MLRVREALAGYRRERVHQRDVFSRRISKIYYVPEGTPLSTQLIKFQRTKRKSTGSPSMNMAISAAGHRGRYSFEEIVGDFTTSMSLTLAEE